MSEAVDQTRPTKRRPDLESLYCINEDGSRNTIHTADVRGRFQTRKRWLWVFLIGFYLVVPWITINGKPALLVDIPRRSFYVLGQTFNAQDFYLFFFVITGVGFALYVVSALFGRVWCGYTCPHTVFLEGVYRRIERFFEGDATRRQRLARSGWTREKVWRRGAKWTSYLLVSFVLAHTVLSYFMPAPDVWRAVTGPPSAHPAAFTFVLLFTAIVYLNFAWFREQLCIVLCPYGRLQGALYDRDTIQVGYDEGRGEPRGKYTQAGIGDCIDCYRCVAVCPTGIDIRNGTQMECIGCANCIDACDEVMAKIGRPPGLIRYDSQNGLEGQERRFVRPRLFVYLALLLAGVVAMTIGFATRTPFEANLVRPAGAPWERTEDGLVRNVLNLHLINKLPYEATFTIEGTGDLPEGSRLQVVKPSVVLASLAEEWVPVIVAIPTTEFEAGDRLVLEIVADSGQTRQADIGLLGPRGAAAEEGN